jgi:hypothetical protein
MVKSCLIALLLLLAGCATTPPSFCGAQCVDQLRQVRWQRYVETPAARPAGAALTEIGILPPLWVRGAVPRARLCAAVSSLGSPPLRLHPLPQSAQLAGLD